VTVIFTRAHVPAELEQAWLQHLRDFAEPALSFQQIFERDKS
jgi:hypothetical protein